MSTATAATITGSSLSTAEVLSIATVAVAWQAPSAEPQGSQVIDEELLWLVIFIIRLPWTDPDS